MKHSQSGLFLLELIIAILFFSLSSAICIQIFVKAHLLNEQSIQKSQANQIASNIIEIYKNDQLETTYKVDSHYIYFNEDGKNVNKDKAYYIADIDLQKTQIAIQISCQNKKIYSIKYKHHRQLQP